MVTSTIDSYCRLPVTKSLMLFNAVIDSLGLRFLPACDKYMHLFLDNANTGYAEVSDMSRPTN